MPAPENLDKEEFDTAAIYSPRGWVAVDVDELAGDVAPTDLEGTIPPGDYLFAGAVLVDEVALAGTVVASVIFTAANGAHTVPLTAAIALTAKSFTPFAVPLRVESGTPQWNTATSGLLLGGLKYSIFAHLLALS